MKRFPDAHEMNADDEKDTSEESAFWVRDKEQTGAVMQGEKSFWIPGRLEQIERILIEAASSAGCNITHHYAKTVTRMEMCGLLYCSRQYSKTDVYRITLSGRYYLRAINH